MCIRDRPLSTFGTKKQSIVCFNIVIPSIKVANSKEFSSKRCGTIPSLGWEVKNVIGENIVVKFKSDSQSNEKGFEAVYTLVSLDGCK